MLGPLENSLSIPLNFKEAHVILGSESKHIVVPSQIVSEGNGLSNLPEHHKKFNAIGRIGEEYNRDYETQNHRPAQSYSRGTGILITHRHILTCRHVYDRYIRDNVGKCGIEFLAIAGYDRSDFYLFSKSAPIFLRALDAVILTLGESPSQDPLPVRSLPAPAGTAVKVISYPHPMNFPDPILYRVADYNTWREMQYDLQMFGGHETIFSTKRESTGQIVRPKNSLPGQNDFFLKHDVLGSVPVFYFKATASSGSSGSPVLNMNNDLLGIYFTGYGQSPGEHVNLAIPIKALLSAILRIGKDKLPAEVNELIEPGFATMA